MPLEVRVSFFYEISYLVGFLAKMWPKSRCSVKTSVFFLMNCSLRIAIWIFKCHLIISENYFVRTIFDRINLWKASFSKIMTIIQISLKFVFFGENLQIFAPPPPPKKKKKKEKETPHQTDTSLDVWDRPSFLPYAV